MIADPWLVKAFVVVQGNLIARQRLTLGLRPFEAALRTGLRAGSPTALWFETPERERLCFEPWLERLQAEGLCEIDLVPAVPGLGPTLLAVDLGRNGCRHFSDRWEREPAAVPSARALFEFVRRYPQQGIEERTAYYAHQLGLIDKDRWEDVERECDPGEDELWVQAFELAQSHVEVSVEAAADWEALTTQHASSKGTVPALVFGVDKRDGSGETGSRRATAVEARMALEEALRENLEVARTGRWTTWITWFTEALERLHVPPAPEEPWVRVTAGCGVPSEVLSLARAAQKSHVFGGMGSWNDVPVDNEAERERLWKAMHEAWGAVFAALKTHSTTG